MSEKTEAMEKVAEDLVAWEEDTETFETNLDKTIDDARAALAMSDDDPWLDPEEPPKETLLLWQLELDHALADVGFYIRGHWETIDGERFHGTVTGYKPLSKPRGRKEKDDE